MSRKSFSKVIGPLSNNWFRLLRECSDRKQTAKDAEDRRAVDNLQKFVETKREQLNEQIQRAEIAVHKCVLAEEIADNHKRQLDTLKNSNIELHALQQQLSVNIVYKSPYIKK